MTAALVLTVIGPDRPGLVRELAAVIADQGGNWLESRMAHLGGQFTGIVRLEVDRDRRDALTAALAQLATKGLAVTTHTDAEAGPPPGTTAGWQLELVGHDRPGIVRDLARVLAQHGVNVEELSSHCESAAMSGELLFRAALRLHLPETCDLDALRTDLENLAAGLMADFTIQPAAPAA